MFLLKHAGRGIQPALIDGVEVKVTLDEGQLPMMLVAELNETHGGRIQHILKTGGGKVHFHLTQADVGVGELELAEEQTAEGQGLIAHPVEGDGRWDRGHQHLAQARQRRPATFQRAEAGPIFGRKTREVEIIGELPVGAEGGEGNEGLERAVEGELHGKHFIAIIARMSRIWILHNPNAGRPGSAWAVERTANALARRGLEVQLRRPASPAEMKAAAHEAVAAQAEAVLVAGGDGSLGVVAAELLGTPTALGFLPVGTANVWAQELGLPMMSWWQPDLLQRTAQLQLEGQVRLTDCGECNGNLFLLWAGMGLDALVMRRLEKHRPVSRYFGTPYNVLATFVLGADWRGAPMRVVAGGHEIEGYYLLAVIANARRYAGLFTLTPEARLDDGQFTVWLFEGRSYPESLLQTARVGLSQHLAHPRVTRLTGEAIELYTPAPQPVHTDGEPWPSTTQLHIHIRPRALRVLTPAHTPAGLYGEAPC